jgi:very-short-patch-repair endonuclease
MFQVHDLGVGTLPEASLNESMERSEKLTRRVRGSWPEIEQRARELRWALTPAEEALWNALLGKRLCGVKWRCQHPVGRFILDFYCPACKLVVEVDGAIHDREEDAEHDSARAKALAAYGYRVVRFQNEEIMNDLDSVLAQIREAVQAHRA